VSFYHDHCATVRNYFVDTKASNTQDIWVYRTDSKDPGMVMRIRQARPVASPLVPLNRPSFIFRNRKEFYVRQWTHSSLISILV